MRFSTATTAIAATAAMLVASTSARVGRGIPQDVKARVVEIQGEKMTPVLRRSPSGPTNEPSAATNTVAAEECKPYTLPEISALKSKYPTVWQTANIVEGDTEAQTLWQNIQNSGIIPTNVQQKGTGGKGNFTDVTPSYPASDPDCWWTYKQCVTPKHQGLNTDIWTAAEPDTWGLTFDDGPNCTHNTFYDFLKTNNQKASLFYIGSNVFDWPLEAQRGIVEGHHICVHTWSHQYTTQLTSEQVFAELYYTGKIIKDVTGVTAQCWRPPYGDVDDRVRAIASGLGMTTNVWQYDTDDWEIQPLGPKPSSVVVSNYNSIIGNNYAAHGAFVLTHEINAYTMDLMMSMYSTIKQHFKYIVPITAVMNITNPYPEAITFPDFEAYIGGQIEPSGIPDGNTIKIQTDATYSPISLASQTAAAANGSKNTTNSTSNSNTKQQTSSKSSATREILKNKVAIASGLLAIAGFVIIA